MTALKLSRSAFQIFFKSNATKMARRKNILSHWTWRYLKLRQFSLHKRFFEALKEMNKNINRVAAGQPAETGPDNTTLIIGQHNANFSLIIFNAIHNSLDYTLKAN